MNVTYHHIAPLGPSYRTWIYEGKKVTLYSVVDAFICLARVAACFKLAVEEPSRAVQYLITGTNLWKYSIQTLQQAHKGHIESFVYWHLYKLHGSSSSHPDYGKLAFNNEAGCFSTPEERYVAIQRAMQETLFTNRPHLHEGFELLNRAVVVLHCMEFFADFSDENHHWNKAKELWRLGNALLQKAAQNEEGINLKEFEGNVYETLWEKLGRPPYLDFGRHVFFNEFGHATTLANKCDAITWVMRDIIPTRFVLAEGSNGNTRDMGAMAPKFVSDCMLWTGYNTLFYYSSGRFCRLDSTRCQEWPAVIIDNWNTLLIKTTSSPQETLWSLFSPETNTMVWSKAHVSAHFNPYVLPPQAELVGYLRDFDIRLAFAGEYPTSVSFEKKCFKSELSGEAWVDKDKWAVTLVSVGQSCISATPDLPLPAYLSSLPPWVSEVTTFYKHRISEVISFFNQRLYETAGHAEIVYEGVREGQYFSAAMHLTGSLCGCSGKIRLDRRFDTSKVRAKTKTWVVSKTQVEALHTLEGQIVPFSPMGNSLLNRVFNDLAEWVESNIISMGYNCLTFSIQTMGDRLGIHLPPASHPEPDAYISSLPPEYRP